MIIICNYCKKESDKPTGAVNRATRKGAPVYCGKECAGFGRRSNKTIEEKKKIKFEYDKKYRELNNIRIKKSKHEYFKKTYDPQKAAIIRKKNMPRHVEYCRQPKYKEYKKGYDVKHRADKVYGEFAECYFIVKEIEKQYDQRDVRQINNLHNKSQKRKQK